MIVLIGESGCGKSTVGNYLINNYNYEKIVSYTTRPIRKGEKDNVDYHFITNEKFNELKRNNFFIESANYNGWQYGTSYDDFANKDTLNKIVVLTPHGLRNLKNKTNNDDIVSFYIKIPRKDRLIKILQRGDDIEEAYRRNLSDVGMFDGIEDEVDMTINNNNYEKNSNDIAQLINIQYQCKLIKRRII